MSRSRNRHGGGRRREHRARRRSGLGWVAAACAAALAGLGSVALAHTLTGGGRPAVVAAPPSASPVTTAPAEGAAPPEPGDEGARAEVEAADAGAKQTKKKRDADEQASGPSKHTDAQAADYLKRDDDTPAKRVKDVRSVGGYLRIYTDLPDTADNSRDAIELCQRGLRYLIEERGVADPVVFVQAEFGENGNPVLANIIGPDDANCRVSHPEPQD
ncbi:hypothetical protein [Spongiactinospora sp. TRM90649]|uniref:hypothetical protein n=1 Tax=Spongiactinospora sp. TRM90649 TaxID=3031114 RepID=UPI0023F95878|nr:hypothetical protein [Spongiactinospora sp. TRM90649]MDF5757905.1 hypothetical protein [Spongiactinospora sp. TRM90649]